MQQFMQRPQNMTAESLNMKERFGKAIPPLTAADVISNAGNVDRETSGNKNEGRWSDSEHINFLKALKKWGRDWKHVAAFRA